MNNNLEELINALYDMIQDAKSVPLSSDKCIIERDKALDMLDDLSAQLPSELKQARTIVASRDELIAQARGEAKNVIAAAQGEAAKLVEKEVIYQQTLQKCREMAEETEAQLNQEKAEQKAALDQEFAAHKQRMEQLKAVTLGYVSDSLTNTEETILEVLNKVRATRSQFQTITGGQNADYDQEL